MKKKVNIILIALVAALWGTVIYRSLKNYLFSESNIASDQQYHSINLASIKKDTFSLKELSYDPFMSKAIAVSEVSNVVSKPTGNRIIKNSYKSTFFKPTKTIKQPETEVLPYLQFLGFIRSTKQKEELVLLRVNDTLKRFTVNIPIKNVTVKRVFKDSVQVLYKKKRITIKKS
jgi:hypothetical protein